MHKKHEMYIESNYTKCSSIWFKLNRFLDKIMRFTQEEILLFILNKINGYIRIYDKCNDKR